SEAKPEIWANWEDFLKKAKAANDAATAMDVASAETIGAGMGALGGACKDCHTTYRAMKQ
ncbi:MAG: cytochrome c, partial [Acetobacteraceae bacterium]